ncbi:phosphonate ABC transporter ATP-binding protein [Pectinatus haikarae]|uniref:Phosphonate transport system ATP-binding protein n=1 Tax=Pectinatus haikarae TaxID=349096 RepID=A0ABT9Y9W7_9FIRM|nr:phosphonate ABC transporter ATP-binding protein [Pectinatus haikarae]MDQ0204634.1 phosphonate transport system ATP-binding protein [Pectinatus haikarae]
MIQIRGLCKEYNCCTTKALTNISFDVQQGQFVVLLGPSGAGKSTLLRCINGLVKATDGEIFIQGDRINDSRKLKDIHRRVGMVFQQFNLVKRLTVLENVLCGRLAYVSAWTSCLKLFSKQDVNIALHCLNRVGLVHKAYDRADQLSGGQQQRVGIARALAQCPSIILADEPVASLDPKSAEKVLTVLRTIKEQDHITVIVSLHNIELANHYAERIIGIKNGRMIVDKPVSAFTDDDVEIIYNAMPDIVETKFIREEAVCTHV